MRYTPNPTLPLALALVISCGEDGPAGADGKAYLAVITDAGVECPEGGVVVDYGYDTDGDEALSDAETVGTIAILMTSIIPAININFVFIFGSFHNVVLFHFTTGPI